MPKWETKREEATFSNVVNMIEWHIREGWEFVFSMASSGRYFLLFKRQVPDPLPTEQETQIAEIGGSGCKCCEEAERINLPTESWDD